MKAHGVHPGAARSGLFHVVRWVLAAAIITLIGATAYLTRVLIVEGGLIEHTYREGTWGAVQTDSEALKLALALERYRRTLAPEDLQALTLQRELYMSRIIFLRDSEETVQVRANTELQNLLPTLYAASEQIDQAVDQIAAGDRSMIEPLQSLLATVRQKTRDLTQELLLKDKTLLDRARLLDVFERMAACLLFIMVAGAILVFLAVRQANLSRASARWAQLAQEEISRQRKRLESALEATHDPFLVSDRTGNVVFANRAYRDLFHAEVATFAPGAPLDALLRAEAGAIEHDASTGAAAAEAAFLARAVTPGQSFMARLNDGRSLLYRTQRMNEGGLVLTRIDLTERQRLERERAEFRDQFHHAMKMEALGRLAGGIAHDFNNMLTAILTFSELLVRDLEAQPAQRRMAEKVTGAALRAAGLVKQILSFTRKEQAELKEVDLGAIAKESLALLRASTPQHILTSFDGAPGAVVMADPGQISQVIMNLCVNARDAINVRPGAIEIMVEHPAYDRRFPAGGLDMTPPGMHAHMHQMGAITSGPDERTHLMHVGAIAPDRPCVCLSVRDTGGGIPRNVLERMFEPFYTTKGIGQGSGLGLAAVHGIVLGLEGAITVETTEGAGTIFRIYLPMAHPPKPQSERKREPSTADAA